MTAVDPAMTARTVVISQSTYFPWVGMLEQVRLADVFVHYDDVAFSRGYLHNRVQVKTADGVKWMTIPVCAPPLGTPIDQVRLDERTDWRSRHRALLRQAYRKALFCEEMLALADRVFEAPAETLADVTRASLLALVHYFGLDASCTFCSSRDLQIEGRQSERVLAHVRALQGARYVTGHGARHYLDHERFARDGVAVEYMNYLRRPYAQLHGAFTPHVTSLDLVANCGVAGAAYICSATIPWREFVASPP